VFSVRSPVGVPESGAAGYRLRRGRYTPIAPVAGRLPSKELGLHLEAAGSQLRFYDPGHAGWLPTPEESRRETIAARRQAEAEAARAEAARRRAETALEQKDAALRQAEAETQRLRQELAALRRQG